MKSIHLGSRDGHPVRIDLARLIESRLLIQGTSGSGKSHALRRIFEQAHDQVQCVIVDPEGEYATLREKFPFLLFGPGGEVTNVSPRNAPMIAREVLGIGQSVVIDLSESKGRDNVAFVNAFNEGLMSAPRTLSHELLLGYEEAHLFAPEGTKNDSADSMADVAKRGRKRGFCVIAATQRLSDLSKGVAGVLGSRLIGLTTLDTDIKRAAYDLGMEPSVAKDVLSVLALGDFYAYGPMFDFKGVAQIHVADTDTKAPKWSARGKPPPPTPEKLRGVLARLEEIPKEAEQEFRDLDSAKARIRDLEREARAKPVPAAPAAPKIIERDVVTPETREALGRIASSAKEAGEALVATGRSWISKADEVLVAVRRTAAVPPAAARTIAQRPVPARPAAAPREASDGGLDRTQQRILDTVAMLGVRGIDANKDSVARWQDLHPKGGSYGTNLGRLRAEGYLDGFDLTERGLNEARASETGFDALLVALPDEPKRAILRTLKDAAGPLSKDELAAALGLHPKGGSFGTNLGWLRTMGVITERGPIALTAGADR